MSNILKYANNIHTKQFHIAVAFCDNALSSLLYMYVQYMTAKFTTTLLCKRLSTPHPVLPVIIGISLDTNCYAKPKDSKQKRPFGFAYQRWLTLKSIRLWFGHSINGPYSKALYQCCFNVGTSSSTLIQR